MNAGSNIIAGTHLPPGKFYGQVLNSKISRSFLICEATYAGGLRLPTHSHELAFFCLLIEGGYKEHCAKRSVCYQPFSVTFYPPGESHRIEIGNSQARVVIVEILPALFERFREHAAVPGPMTDLGGGELLWLSARLLREYRGGYACSPLAIEGLILEMLAATARIQDACEKRVPCWVANVRELLHAEFKQSLPMSYLAAKVGVHPVHLSRIFRKHYRQTISDYVNKLRVRFACQQLYRNEATITDIALSAGFCDQSHFTRIFKRLVGCTPGDFRSVSSHRKGWIETV